MSSNGNDSGNKTETSKPYIDWSSSMPPSILLQSSPDPSQTTKLTTDRFSNADLSVLRGRSDKAFRLMTDQNKEHVKSRIESALQGTYKSISIIIDQDWVRDWNTFLDQIYNNPQEANKFFDGFRELWTFYVNCRLYELAAQLMLCALGVADNWEKSTGKNIHKGTPFYFLGGSRIFVNNIDSGFIAMHNALIEDTKNGLITSTTKTPSYYFSTLDASKTETQYFKERFDRLLIFLEKALQQYRNDNSRVLDLSGLRLKFFSNPTCLNEIYLFSYIAFKLEYLIVDVERSWRQVPPGSFIAVQGFFNLALLTDVILEKNELAKNITSDNYYQRLINHSKTNGYGMEKPMVSNKNVLNIINEEKDVDFSATIECLLDNRPLPMSRVTVVGMAKYYGIVYAFRNHAAHTISHFRLIGDRAEEIERAMLYAFFDIIEKS